jgi:hypothetical protein
LTPGSNPAIGDGLANTGLTTDQRGIALAIPADIGAFQLETVTTNTANLLSTVGSLTIAGSAFDTAAPNDSVSFSNYGVTGSVASATSTSLTVSVTGLAGLTSGTPLLATVTVDTVSSGTATQVATIQTGLAVDSVAATPDGVVLTFDAPIDPTTTVLYSTPGDTTLGPADVIVTGPGDTAIRGSLVIDPTNPDMATFVQTTGLLSTGGYTVTVTTGVKAVGGLAMTGNYSTTITVTSPTTPVLSVPSFARGPGQPVALTDSTGNTTGIPVAISSATGVTQASFSLTYDPQLLTIASTGALSLSTAASTAGLSIQSYTITSVDANHSVLTVSISVAGQVSRPAPLQRRW